MRSLKDFIEGDRNEGFHAEFYEELQKKDEELGFMRSIEQSEKGKGDLSESLLSSKMQYVQKEQSPLLVRI